MRRVVALLLPLFAALVALVYLPGLPVFVLGTLCFLIGFFGSSQIVCFALVKENHRAGLSGTAIGFVNSMVTGAGALFQPLVGLLLDLAWSGETSQGARIYDTAAYQLAFVSLVACCVAGFLFLLAVRETYCRPAETREAYPQAKARSRDNL